MGTLSRLRLPRLGETMEEARVVVWLKAEGEVFRRGDVLLEVETDKTAVEVPALQDGVLVKHLVQPGDLVQLDAEIAEVAGEAGAALERPEPVRAAPAVASRTEAPPGALHRPETSARTPASPAARRLAQRHGLDLSTVAASGPRGRVQQADVRAVLGDAAPNGEAPHLVATSAGPVAYRRIGTGAMAAVFLHGLFADGLAWRSLPSRAAAHGLTALAFDLPGHGASGARVTSADALTDCLAEALAELAPEARYVLVGHSFGAIAAAGLAARLGERAVGLILSAPAGIGLRLDAGFVAAMLGAQTPDTLRHALELLGPEAGPISAAALEAELTRLRQARSGHAEAAVLAARDGVQTTDIRPLLDRCAPLPHVLVGRRDRVLDWQDALHLSPRAAVHVCPEAGHMPHLAVPALMQELIAAAAR
ncbi:MAG: alpha/beta fold hydrolase [Geminicoccaceae bacterium]|nr:MAG: alpha/beta fold hydrolase [Geminicoccaceae bacterium]